MQPLDKELGYPLLKLEGYPQGGPGTMEPEEPILMVTDLNGQPISKRKLGRTLGAKDKKRRRRKVTPTSIDASNAAAMYAIGVSKTKISKLLDLSKLAVDDILKRPEVREFALKVREVIRVSSLANIQQVNQDAYDWLNEIIGKKGDAKAFDYLTRGIAALEKVASSSSGENQKVNAQIEHTVSGDLSEEAKALVKALIGPTNEPTHKSG